MNNSEKREYISRLLFLQSLEYDFFPEMRKEFLESIPRSLFKYKKIDGYIFDMIDNQYIYMATSKELDDKFECSVDVDIDEIYEGKTNNLNKETMELFYDALLKYFAPERKKVARDIINSSVFNGKFDTAQILHKMMDCGYEFPNAEQKVLVNAPAAFEPLLRQQLENGGIIKIINTAKCPEITFGFYSLAESNDNRMMWSLYADNYSGCCIEYDFSNSRYIKYMFPVIYEPSHRCNIIKNVIVYTVNILVRRFSDNVMPADLSQLYAPFITKDASFEPQREWRLINDPKSKIPSPKIKAIYLGSNMSTENIEKMKERAKKFGFKLYKAVTDTKKNEIVFEEIRL